MACVIDTSAIIAVLLSEPERALLVRATRGTELVAPASVHWEIGNALSAGLKRRRFTLAQGQRALTAYAAIPIRFVEVDLALSLELAAEHALYAYDAYLLTCALQQRAPLLTLDAGLVRTATTLGIDLVLPAS
jgi:predicted nucleic acid-binding protein